MTKQPTRILVHLGSGEDGEHRQAALLAAAESVGAIGQRGPSISSLLQMIADGQLEVAMTSTYQYWQHKRSGDVYGVQIVGGHPVYITDELHHSEINRDPSAHNFDHPFDGRADDYDLYVAR